MKLSTRDAARYFADPDRSAAGALIYGADAMRVADKRQALIAKLIGPDGASEMRLDRMSAAELRKDPARLVDAIKAQGFFPGPRVVFVEEAADGANDALTAGLRAWVSGDAQIIVSAGALPARSKLRKTFESHKSAYAIGIYDTPPSREEIEAELRKAGVTTDRDALDSIMALGRALDPGDLRQTIEKLALYKFGDSSPVTATDLDACAPTTLEAAMDDILHAVAEAQTPQIGPLMQRLSGQGVTPVALCIGAMRHFKTLYVAKSDPGGPSQGMGRLRPPVFGPRRDRLMRQAQSWTLPRLEQALETLTDTDLALRSAGQTAPQMALVERSLIRLTMLARAR